MLIGADRANTFHDVYYVNQRRYVVKARFLLMQERSVAR